MSLYFHVIVWFFMINITCLLLLGFVKQHVWRHPSSCAMTYMYKSPQYIPIELDADTKTKFPNYNLWIYGEGKYAEQLGKNSSYNGIPVLFIPGNSGSYKQVRSLASVSMTKSDNNRSPIVFNYYTVDFGEVRSPFSRHHQQINEFSAFYGGSPIRETEFAAACIKHILTLYSSTKKAPQSVILIGHSMGGAIATGVMSLPYFNPHLVDVIYTIGSPHYNPVSVPDFEMLNFYDQVHSYWSSTRNGGNSSHINVVSIGSGVADVMVKSDLVQLPVDSANSIVVMTTHIPHVWTTMDHLCLLWCNQLVLSIVRSMFELVDVTSLQLKGQSQWRQNVLEKHFLLGNSKAEALRKAEEVTVGHDWIYKDNLMQWSHKKDRRYDALLLEVEDTDEHLVIKTFNMDVDSWIFGCQLNQQDKCKLGTDYSSESIYLPSTHSTIKLVHLQRHHLANNKYLVILLPKQKRNDVLIYAEKFDSAGRYLSVDLSSAFLGSNAIEIQPHSMFSSVALVHYSSPWLAFRATVRPDNTNCQATSHFHCPWSNEDTFVNINQNATNHVLRIINTNHEDDSSHPTLNLYLDAKCSYSIQLQFSLLDTIEQIIRRHWLQMPIFLCACLFQSLAKQFYSLATTGKVRSGWNTASVYVIFRNVAAVQTLAFVYNQLHWAGLDSLPSLHWIYTGEDKFHSVAVFLLIYLAVAGVGTGFLAAVNVLLIVTAKITTYIIKLLRWNFVFGCKADLGLIGSFLVVLTSALSLYLAQRTSGVVVLCVVSLVAIAKMFWSFVMMYGSKSTSTSAHYETHAKLNFSLTFIWIAAFLSKGTQFAYWLRNLRWSVTVDPDPSFLPAIIITVAFLTFRPFDLTNKKQLRSLKLLSSIQNGFSLVVLLFQIEHVHLLIWTLAVDVILISVWSSLARNRDQLINKSADVIADGKTKLFQWKDVVDPEVKKK
ncbi:GPI inositol-deacylase [Chamberlinius hualienensis]